MSLKFRKSLSMVLVPAALALGAPVACFGSVGVDVNINVGAPRVVIPPPVVVPQGPFITIDDDVDFVYPRRLGFYVAVGVPYDLFFVRNNYYLCRDGRWFRATGSRGPWVVMHHSDLPPGLRKHNLERIRVHRSAEYDVYRRDRDGYRGRHFRTAREEWKEHHRAEKEYRKDERREDKEYRKEMKRAEKEERRHYRHDRD